jgi:hypothetical protein
MLTPAAQISILPNCNDAGVSMPRLRAATSPTKIALPPNEQDLNSPSRVDA